MQGTVPEILGGFQLIERVATGGMASLYLGRRAGARGFVKPVALKIFHSDLGEDQEFVEMFIDEAHILSRLNHPNIVHVEELGEDQGFMFLVMEFVDGCPVRAVLKQARQFGTPLPVPLAVHIAACAADGLHYAHEARDESNRPLGIVHRDVSPTNLLLSHDGHVKVIDFGIAKSAEQVHQTTFRRLKGKVAYMSPEQVKCGPLDRRSDIYSLGVVLWEMLANRRAFLASDEIALVYEVSSNPITPITELRTDLPDKLVQALHGATQRPVGDRFSTGLEFRRALIDAVPEALQVQETQIGALAQRVTGSAGAKYVPLQKRVRSVRNASAVVQSSIPVTPSRIVPAVEPARTMATTLSSETPAPHESNQRLMNGVVAGIVAGALLLWSVMMYIERSTPRPPVTSYSSQQLPEPRRAPPPPLNTSTAQPSEVTSSSPPRQEAPAPSPKPEPKPEPRRTASSRKPKSSPQSERNVSRRISSRTSPRRTRETSEPEPGPATPAKKPTKPKREDVFEVDGYLLAAPDELDRAAIRGKERKKNEDVIEQDDIILADEYQ